MASQKVALKPAQKSIRVYWIDAQNPNVNAEALAGDNALVHSLEREDEEAWCARLEYLNWAISECDSNSLQSPLVSEERQNGFYVFHVWYTFIVEGLWLEGYGDRQIIVMDLSKIKGKWDEGKSITSCCTSKGSTYYIVMTGNGYLPQYQGQNQCFFSRSSWPDVKEKNWKELQGRKDYPSAKPHGQQVAFWVVRRRREGGGISKKPVSPNPPVGIIPSL